MSNNNPLLLREDRTSLEQLFQIQTQSPPTPILLFNANNIYDINLNTREIDAPRVLSLSGDHRSTVVYFKFDRYYDYMDLTNTICIIQYVPPGGDKKVPFIYVVPFFDVMTYKDEGKVLIPWDVGGPATQQEGKIDFSIRFYKVVKDEVDNSLRLVYNLNTIPASSKILYSLEGDAEAMQVKYDQPIASQLDYLINQLSNQHLEWTIL